MDVLDRIDGPHVVPPAVDATNSGHTERLDVDALRALSRLDPRISTLHMVFEWALLLGASALCWRFFHPLGYLLTVAFIGARQHSLGLLMHDAAHQRLFSNRRLNDWIGELFLAWPFLVLSMRSYRENHLHHHRHLNSDADPDWVAKQNAEWSFPMKPTKLWSLLLLDLIGVGFFKLLAKARALPKPKAEAPDQAAMRFVRPLYVMGIITFLVWKGMLMPFLLFWIVPFLTWFQLCLRVRSIAEHFAISNRRGFYAGTRSTERGVLDRLFFLSNDASLHAEHHLYPSVPFYRLRALHHALMSRPAYGQSLQLTRGYLQVLRECTKLASPTVAP